MLWWTSSLDHVTIVFNMMSILLYHWHRKKQMECSSMCFFSRACCTLLFPHSLFLHFPVLQFSHFPIFQVSIVPFSSSVLRFSHFPVLQFPSSPVLQFSSCAIFQFSSPVLPFSSAVL